MPRQVEHARRRRSPAPRAGGNNSSIKRAAQSAAASGGRPGRDAGPGPMAWGAAGSGAGPAAAPSPPQPGQRRQRTARWPRPGPRSNRPASSIQISASAPHRLQPQALVGGGGGSRRNVVQSALATLRANGSAPRAQRAARRGRGREPAGEALPAAAIMRAGRRETCRGFRPGRHLSLAAAWEPRCWRGRALPAPNMAGRGGGHVGRGPSLCPHTPPPAGALCGAATWAPNGECGPGRGGW